MKLRFDPDWIKAGGCETMLDVDIVGFGYQGRTVDELCAELLDAGVALVCDVRMTPISRKPGLSKNALASALRSVGIDYQHLPILGNPKWNRSGFAGSNAQLETAQQTFRAIVLGTPGARYAVGEVREQARELRTALLCFERDERRCHRSLIIADVLSDDELLTQAR